MLEKSSDEYGKENHWGKSWFAGDHTMKRKSLWPDQCVIDNRLRKWFNKTE